MSIQSLIQDEKKAVKNYGEHASATKDQNEADTFRHIQDEEKHHAEELSKLAQENKMAKKHHKFTHTTVEHHDDGSHTITHHHEDGKSHKKYAAADHDSMMDGMMDHTSMPNPGEAEAAPAAATPAAGAPMPPAAGV